ncbi:MAG: sodium:proton exchanger [Epsilonproteobacteria bacterium]|nr:sodium:proton exchanger [Campylobacterota bacterium]
MIDEPDSGNRSYFTEYWDLVGGFIFAFLALYFHHLEATTLSAVFSAASIGLFSITVSEIAEILAHRISEPYGSYLLTISAVVVEIILLFSILLQSTQNIDAIETVKGGIISAVLVDMNVLLGLAVFIGGLSFKEQQHNEDTSSSYTTILYVASLTLLVPGILDYTEHGKEVIKSASLAISLVLFLFYIIILIFQTKTHTDFFKSTARSRIFRYKKMLKEQHADDDEKEDESVVYIFEKLPTTLNFISMLFFVFVIGVMAEIFAKTSLPLFKEFSISTGIAGLLIAIISVTPEIFTAIKAAKDDQIQRVINIAMGASTVSILLTVPILMFLGFMFKIDLVLNFNPLQVGALIFTVILAWKTTDNGETNYFEGLSHLMLFISYAIIAGFY